VVRVAMQHVLVCLKIASFYHLFLLTLQYVLYGPKKRKADGGMLIISVKKKSND
jgi:hypothetical protein